MDADPCGLSSKCPDHGPANGSGGGGGDWTDLGNTLAQGAQNYFDLVTASGKGAGAFDWGLVSNGDAPSNLDPDYTFSYNAGHFLPAMVTLAVDGYSAGGFASGGGGDGPDFVVTPTGTAIVIPEGATGPTPAFTGGGNGLNGSVTGVRIMDPTPQYPNGYANYNNGLEPGSQVLNPYTGKQCPRTDPWWHQPL